MGQNILKTVNHKQLYILVLIQNLLAIEWFESNYMNLNKGTCHFIISGYKHEIMFANIGKSRIWEKGQQKFLGVTIDKKS